MTLGLKICSRNNGSLNHIRVRLDATKKLAVLLADAQPAVSEHTSNVPPTTFVLEGSSGNTL
jgi:hypothetical protein